MKYWEKISGFWDKCILICSDKFPALWPGYLPSAVSGLTKCTKNLDLSKSEVSSSVYVRMMEKKDKSALLLTSSIFGAG